MVKMVSFMLRVFYYNLKHVLGFCSGPAWGCARPHLENSAQGWHTALTRNPQQTLPTAFSTWQRPQEMGACDVPPAADELRIGEDGNLGF